jgi:CRP/FNR family transcriptional regulator
MTAPPASEAASAIQGIPYLRALPPGERAALVRFCAFRDLVDGELLFAEGDAPPGIFLIVSGRIKLVRSSADGREQVLHEEGAGATLAEVPVFDGGGCVGSAVAVGGARVFMVPSGALFTTLERNPGSARQVIAVMASRVRKFAALVEDLSLRAVSARVAGYLLRESARTGDAAWQLPVTRAQLAAHVGTVREQVSRVLSRLSKAGIVEIHGRRIRIVDPRRLRAIADERP